LRSHAVSDGLGVVDDTSTSQVVLRTHSYRHHCHLLAIRLISAHATVSKF
jgi:hypothetical protein